MTGPVEGDRVRCTLGESVIVGEVIGFSPDGPYVMPDGGVRNLWIPTPNWTVEVIPPPPPPLPEIEGTVVLDWTGRSWQLWSGYWRNQSVMSLTTAELDTTRGPLTVLYVPEVTS